MKTILRGALCAALTAALLLLCSCSGNQPFTVSFQAMDTVMSLTVYGGEDTCQKLRERIEALDALFDATDQDSEIARLNTEKTASVSADTADLLRRSLMLCEQLDGAFDITVYPAVCAWGFTSGDYRVPNEGELAALAEAIDYRGVVLNGDTVTIPEAAAVDLGAVAKGYAADVSAGILRNSGALAAVLNLGGTICLYGEKPDGSCFKVGVADPENPAGYFGYLSCDEAVVATSGGYERYFEQDGVRYIHILDPSTAKPVDNGVLSVTIVCQDGATADALSTALFVMGADKAATYYRQNDGFDFIILTDDGSLYITEGIYDDFTLADGYDFTLQKVAL